MPYNEIVQTITILLETEQLTDEYLWYLGFEVVKILHDHNNLSVHPQKDVAPTLCGLNIIVDYEKPCVIKLYKECNHERKIL